MDSSAVGRSARARSAQIQFSCIEHPDGLTLRTREQQAFLVLNGIQTQSAKVCNLVQEMDDMEALGVDIVRLSPQAQHMPEVIAIFDAVRRRELDGAAALTRLLPLMPEQACNGYWHGHPGMDQVAADAAPAQEVALGTR